MENSVVAVKVYNGTYVPVLDATSTKRRRLVLTTVRDSQTSVKIDLYRATDEQMADAEYIASLVIENIEPAPKGEPDISLLLGVDESGNLNATATDTRSGEYQSLSVGLESLEPGGSYDIPDFELNDEELTLDDLSLDEDDFSLDETSLEADARVGASSDLDLEGITLDDVGVELPGPEETTADVQDTEDTEGAEGAEETELSADDSAMEDDLDLAGLPDFSDDSISFDESLGTEEFSLDQELSIETEELASDAGEESIETLPAGDGGGFDEEIGLEGPVDEAELTVGSDDEIALEETEVPTLDEGMVEADLGDEDFTFDDDEPISFEESPGDLGNEFDETLGGESEVAIAAGSGDELASEFGADFDTEFDTEFGDSDFSTDLGEGDDLEMSADEFDRLDSQPVTSQETEESPPVARRSNGFIFVGYLLLSLAALGVITYFIFRLMEGPSTPPLRTAALIPILASPVVRRRSRKP